MAKSAPKAQKRGNAAAPPRVAAAAAPSPQKRGDRAAKVTHHTAKTPAKPAGRPVATPAPKVKEVLASKPATKANPKPSAKSEPKVEARVEPKVESKPAGKAKVPLGKPAIAPAKVAPAVKKRNDFAAKVVKMIAEDMAIEEAELTNTASFKEDLNLDEIDLAELLMQAESHFDVHPFSEEDWEGCDTVGDFIDLVEKRVEARRARKTAGKAARH